MSFAGVDIDLHRKVAIKILSEKHRDNSELRRRFSREARAVAAISHPNVVQVFTTGLYDDRPYIAMEFLDGTDLGSLVEERGASSSLVAARAVRDAALGLQAAAKAGLIHRDVKPTNLVLLHDGLVKVTDFGLAKPLDPGDEPALTALGVVVGTPDYIAPEQARGETIDERVDIYALGGTLYFMLTGVPPFRTGKPSEDKYLKVVARHLKKPAPDARSKNPEADVALAKLARAMMAKKPAERPSYDELLGELEAVIERLEKGASKAKRKNRGRGLPKSGSHASPTPYVGGDTPNALSDDLDEGDDEAAPTRVRIPSGPHGTIDAPLAGTYEDTVDAPYELHPDNMDPVVQQPKVSRLLVATTVISALIFVVGLGLLLFGPMPEGPAAAPSTSTVDAAVGAVPERPVDAGVAVKKIPEPPDGMFLVQKSDGTPWFFAARRTVTHGEYAAVFPNQKKPSKRLRNRPVTKVSFAFAQSFAEAQNKRLLSAAEWEAAAKSSEFVTDKKLSEWLAPDDGSANPRAKSQLVRSRKGTDKRKARGDKDITFRLAADLPPSEN